MKTLMMATIGLLVAGALGGSQLSAQGLNLKVEKNNKKVEIRVGHDRHDHGREMVRRERVWVEDYVMVEEHYRMPDRYEMVEKKVWVPEKHIKVHEDVWIAARTEVRREARRDHCGNIFYVNVTVNIPGRYECREVMKCVPGHYITVKERVLVPGECKVRLVKKVTGGHWEYRNVVVSRR